MTPLLLVFSPFLPLLFSSCCFWTLNRILHNRNRRIRITESDLVDLHAQKYIIILNEPKNPKEDTNGVEVEIIDINNSKNLKIFLEKETMENLLINKKENTCCICLTEYLNSDLILKTKCKHHYHSECLLKWFEQKINCPFCRNDCIDNN